MIELFRFGKANIDPKIQLQLILTTIFFGVNFNRNLLDIWIDTLSFKNGLLSALAHQILLISMSLKGNIIPGKLITSLDSENQDK